MSKIKKFFATILGGIFSLLVFGPYCSVRIAIRGAQEIAAFRAEHRREPTEQEFDEISGRVAKECTHGLISWFRD
jgi:hypothetical protein